MQVILSGVLGGYTRGYTAYTNLRVFLKAVYLQALRNAPLRIPTSIFSNTPLVILTDNGS